MTIFKKTDTINYSQFQKSKYNEREEYRFCFHAERGISC
ncbi:hypothetical protein B4099_2744 [Heyndrickxia coagulans]|uniref:Uncharacterized protein n=1 Tax=Heyndrickxia coagulans TaxID=1398 RepID=A0A150KJ02_HEYCO|nr:hypothetical protein B4099_2744 [Heyndrickxia coagulans]